VHTKVKLLSPRNQLIVGLIGIAVIAASAVAALEYDKLPMFKTGRTYHAYFAEAGGLRADAEVEVAGMEVGQVTGIALDGDRVRVTFTVDRNIAVGDRTEAAIKTKTLLGTKILEVSPRGTGQQTEAIPLNRTTSPYQLPDAIGDLTSTLSGLNTSQLSDSLKTLATTFADTPPQVQPALEGVARLSQSLNARDAQLRTLIDNANKASAVLGSRTDKIVRLVHDSNELLAELLTQSQALDQISSNISGLAKQISGFVADNRDRFKPTLDTLNGALAIVDNRKEQVQKSIKMLNAFNLSLGEALSSGPFFSVYIANLLPGQFTQPFVGAAFSDLGLDPNVLLPSQLTDPQVGQPATPALPVPYPRTGQGGEPNLTLPDAITGKPGDTRYLYREPLPAPPPGGPPPGPPAPPVGQDSIPTPMPTPVSVPAPDEVPSTTGGQP
jgi:phospholipid/cholesterol/gamma-HCH transport system substrate-binding protein